MSFKHGTGQKKNQREVFQKKKCNYYKNKLAKHPYFYFCSNYKIKNKANITTTTNRKKQEQ